MVAENLFGPGVDPTGETIRNQLFRVIGVMTPKGASSSGQNQDDQIFAPCTTASRSCRAASGSITSWSRRSRATGSRSWPTP